MTAPFRPYGELPEDLYVALRAKAKAHNDEVSWLYRYWIMRAAEMVREGQGHLLPQVDPKTGRSPYGTVSPGAPPHRLRWRQSEESFEECRILIRAGGSSVPAVLREGARAYVASGSVTPTLSWPPREFFRAAA